MKSEKMYEAVSGISDDIIETAGEYRFEKRKRSLAWLGYAAAACLVLGAAAFGVSRLVKKPADTLQAALPTQENVISTQATNETEAPEKTVLYCTGEQVEDNSYPNPGEVNISHPLADEIHKEKNADCLFAVVIALTHTYDDIWDELNEEWRNAVQDPDCVKYDTMFSDWEWETFTVKEMRPDEIAAYYGLSYDEFDDRPNHPTRGYILMNEDFKEYLKDKVDPEEYARLVAAHERLDAIDDEMSGSRTRINAACDAANAAECERLKALGYDVRIEDGKLIGFLSGEQIANFPCSDIYGCCIYWIGEENIMDA